MLKQTSQYCSIDIVNAIISIEGLIDVSMQLYSRSVHYIISVKLVLLLIIQKAILLSVSLFYLLSLCLSHQEIISDFTMIFSHLYEGSIFDFDVDCNIAQFICQSSHIGKQQLDNSQVSNVDKGLNLKVEHVT